MRQVFYKAVPWIKEDVLLALEAGVDGLIVPEENFSEASGLARVHVISESRARFVTLTGKADEDEAFRLAAQGEQVFLALGWEVIPVENLLARLEGSAAVFGVCVSGLDEGILASQILQRGVPRVVVMPEGVRDIRAITAALKHSGSRLALEPAVVTAVTPVGMGHRVCVDTASLLKTSQGMLVGNSAGFFFLVHAETEPNQYVAERPFRVNAGGVHCYCLGPDDSTAYLSELKAGSRVLIVDAAGETSQATVGRAKVEQRPLLLIEAEMARPGGDPARGAVFVQNAETIRLLSPDAGPVSVVDLQPGSRVLCLADTAGRHFGMRISEDIVEE